MSVTTIKSSVVKQSLYRLFYTEIKKERRVREVAEGFIIVVFLGLPLVLKNWPFGQIFL